MTTFYTYDEDTKQLTPARRLLHLDGKVVLLGNAADFAKHLNAYPKGVDTPPGTDRHHRAVPDGYELKDGRWVRVYRVEPVVYTVDDYDRIMEDYLKQVRSDRGYTTREPTLYFNSSNPRWRSDAEDWGRFIDAVMDYGLKVQNEYAATGNAPTIAEFVSGLPKMVWRYKEEDQTSVKLEEHYEVEGKG